jgi:hypothetical protein
MYAVPVDTIIAKNPGCENGLKVGQRLKLENAVPLIQVDLLSVSVEENTREVPKPSEEVKSKFIVSLKIRLSVTWFCQLKRFTQFRNVL